jgi:hypothetical protein
MPAGISLALGVTVAAAILVVSMTVTFAFSPEWVRTTSTFFLLCVTLAVQVCAAFYIIRYARRGHTDPWEGASQIKADRTSRPEAVAENPGESTEETVYFIEEPEPFTLAEMDLARPEIEIAATRPPTAAPQRDKTVATEIPAGLGGIEFTDVADTLRPTWKQIESTRLSLPSADKIRADFGRRILLLEHSTSDRFALHAVRISLSFPECLDELLSLTGLTAAELASELTDERIDASVTAACRRIRSISLHDQELGETTPSRSVLLQWNQILLATAVAPSDRYGRTDPDVVWEVFQAIFSRGLGRRAFAQHTRTLSGMAELIIREASQKKLISFRKPMLRPMIIAMTQLSEP